MSSPAPDHLLFRMVQFSKLTNSFVSIPSGQYQPLHLNPHIDRSWHHSGGEVISSSPLGYNDFYGTDADSTLKAGRLHTYSTRRDGSHQVDLIWPTRISLPKLIFISVRYGNLAIILVVFLFTFTPLFSPVGCRNIMSVTQGEHHQNVGGTGQMFNHHQSSMLHYHHWEKVSSTAFLASGRITTHDQTLNASHNISEGPGVLGKRSHGVLPPCGTLRVKWLVSIEATSYSVIPELGCMVVAGDTLNATLLHMVLLLSVTCLAGLMVVIGHRRYGNPGLSDTRHPGGLICQFYKTGFGPVNDGIYIVLNATNIALNLSGSIDARFMLGRFQLSLHGVIATRVILHLRGYSEEERSATLGSMHFNRVVESAMAAFSATSTKRWRINWANKPSYHVVVHVSSSPSFSRRSPRRFAPSLVVTVHVHSLSFYGQYTSFIHWSPRVRRTWEDLEPPAHELQSAFSDSTTGAHREGVPGLAGPRRRPLFQVLPSTSKHLHHLRAPESQETVRAVYPPPFIRLHSPSSSTSPYTQELLVKSKGHARQSSESHVEPAKADTPIAVRHPGPTVTHSKRRYTPRVSRTKPNTPASFGYATLCLVDGATNSEQEEVYSPPNDAPHSLPSTNDTLRNGTATPHSFEDFLDEYEDLCTQYNLPEAKIVTSLPRYAPNSDARAMWQLLAKDDNVLSSWDAYRKLLIENTPGAGEDRRYLKVDLDKLVSETQSKPMRTRSQLNDYWKKFFVISEYLVANRHLAIDDRSSAFLQGLPAPLCRHVQDQLRREHPTRHPDDPLSLQDVFKVTNFVLATPMDASEDDPDSSKPRTRRNAIPAASLSPTSPVSHPRISDMPSSIEQSPNVAGALMQAVTALTKIIEGFMASTNTNSCQGFKTKWNTSPGTSSAPQCHDFRRLETCVACQSPSHFARECSKLQEYMNKGRGIRNSEGKVCYPDGIVVRPRSYPGRNILERLDSWHAHQRLRTQNAAPQYVPEAHSDSSTTAKPTTSSVAQTHLQDVSEVRCQPSSSTKPSAPQYMSTEGPQHTRSLPTDVQKAKPSPYFNEIFAANTLLDIDDSDSDSDEDVSALETMLQERRRRLNLARSKLRSQASQATYQLMKDEERKLMETPFDSRSIWAAHHASSSQRRAYASSGT
ncbi:hypothetical protein NMY22_g2109 [Coprinellus aureogranulatus]|nr:hypothetical protein NMY22_g2109 [Coprinellus aureogranulatus]